MAKQYLKFIFKTEEQLTLAWNHASAQAEKPGSGFEVHSSPPDATAPTLTLLPCEDDSADFLADMAHLVVAVRSIVPVRDFTTKLSF